MNTPAHAVINLLILGKKERPQRNLPILIGAILPDLPMVLFYFYEKVVQKVQEVTIWSELYFDIGWQAFFNFFNSLPLMIFGTLLAYRFQAVGLTLFFASLIFHVFGDLPFHNDDAHAHFFPFSDWQFNSPISYWDPSHYGHIFSRLEAAIVIMGCLVLIKRHRSIEARSVIIGLISVYILYWSYVLWVWR